MLTGYMLEGQGNKRVIVCPYHQWCYETDGRFRSARGQHALEDWLFDNANLKPVRLENYGGFLFVNLDQDARPLVEQAPRFLRDMYECCPRLDELVRVRRFEREISANWKTVIDNNHECYHCKVNHKSLMELVDYDNKAVWTDDGIAFTHTVERNHLDNSAYTLDEETGVSFRKVKAHMTETYSLQHGLQVQKRGSDAADELAKQGRDVHCPHGGGHRSGAVPRAAAPFVGW